MSRVKIVLPSVFSSVTNGERNIDVFASTVSEVLNRLTEKYGEQFKDKVFDSNGKPRRLLNFYVNGKNIAHIQGLETRLTEGDEISILPAVSGG